MTRSMKSSTTVAMLYTPPSRSYRESFPASGCIPISPLQPNCIRRLPAAGPRVSRLPHGLEPSRQVEFCTFDKERRNPRQVTGQVDLLRLRLATRTTSHVVQDEFGAFVDVQQIRVKTCRSAAGFDIGELEADCVVAVLPLQPADPSTHLCPGGQH